MRKLKIKQSINQAKFKGENVDKELKGKAINYC